MFPYPVGRAGQSQGLKVGPKGVMGSVVEGCRGEGLPVPSLEGTAEEARWVQRGWWALEGRLGRDVKGEGKPWGGLADHGGGLTGRGPAKGGLNQP